MAPNRAPDTALVAAGFSQRLRDAGLPISVDLAARLVDVIELIEPATISELYWCTRIALLGDIDNLATFDSVFVAIFGPHSAGDGSVGGLVEVTGANEVQTLPEGDEDEGRVTLSPTLSMAATSSDSDADDDTGLRDYGKRSLASDDESFSQRSLAELSDDELKRAKDLIARFVMATPVRPTRRRSRTGTKAQIDVRRTVRRAVRTGGDPVKLLTSAQGTTPRRVVMIVDVSASMEPFAQPYVHFMHCLSSSIGSESFVFSTQLTRITEEIGTLQTDQAISKASNAARDRFGGTRISDALRVFIDDFGRRGMARGAVVVIASDGWEQGDPKDLGEQMRRLSLLANRIIWVNPRKAAPEYRPLTGGMSVALPYCDVLLSGHSLAGLSELCDYLQGITK